MTTESAFVGVVERMRRDTADRNPASRERARACPRRASRRQHPHRSCTTRRSLSRSSAARAAPSPMPMGTATSTSSATTPPACSGIQREARACGGRRGAGHQHQRRRRAPRRDPIRRTGVHPLRSPTGALHQLRHRSEPDGHHPVEDRHRAFDDHGDVRRLPRRGLLLLARQRAVERAVPHRSSPRTTTSPAAKR